MRVKERKIGRGKKRKNERGREKEKEEIPCRISILHFQDLRTSELWKLWLFPN